MALVKALDYVRLHNARTQYNPVTHRMTIMFPSGQSITVPVQIVNGDSYINVQ